MNELFFEQGNDIFLEASNEDTKLILTKIYPKIKVVMDTPKGKNKFKQIVGNFMDKNSDKLYTPGPQYLIPFLESDKNMYYELFDIDPDEIKVIIKELTTKITAQSDWAFIRGNPVFTIFMCVIRYAAINKDEQLKSMALAGLSLSMYPSIFTKYFTFEPNDSIMQYTIDNLSLKSTIKKEKHIFGVLMARANQSYAFHEKNLIRGYDYDFIQFLTRLRNDQNSFMKLIAGEFHNNHKKGIGSFSAVDSFEGDSVIDLDNNTNKVSAIAERVSMGLIIHGIDYRLADASAKACKISTIDLRNYLNEIVNAKNTDDMQELIEAIIFLFIYEDKRPISEISTRSFLEFSLITFKRANSKNINNVKIKNILERWSVMVGLNKTFSREATINDYKRAMYMFFVFSIQKYN